MSEVANDYKHTMNLPKTDFAMRAGLPQNEPKRLEKWESMDIYERVLEHNKDNEPYILHDGPPYANGPIHIGHAFNKILKDFVGKYKSQRGFYTPYTPGWDCHGQPIEHMVEEKLGPEKMAKIDQPTLRRLCREWAEKYVDIQRDGFKRLGVRGDWENPYLTIKHEYEAGNVEIFKKMYETGAIYRGRKPVHWCKHCHTALAEAEIEYGDETSPSIFVRFELTTVPTGLEGFDGAIDAIIWTTTPWTMPADMAVILSPVSTYVAVLHDGRAEIMAEALVAKCCEDFGWEQTLVEGWSATGEELVGNEYIQPIFDDARGKFITADYVSLDDGTGIVHSAPGHGVDDYIAGCKFDIPVVMPVDDDGRFYEGSTLGTGGPFSGMDTDEANPHVIEFLRDRGTLVLQRDISHSYPHCWRCHEPVIFRATEQWFVSMDGTGLRKQALDAIDKVQWIPEWSKNRIGAMVADRPDWCISRQRSWGVPIPVFKCAKCGEVVATPETFDAVIELFNTQGADAWFTLEPSEYLPAGTACEHCGSTELVPEHDILDVWWESGVSHTSVCEKNPRLSRPADLYLEGSDQHRGWFQSSLLTGVGAYGEAPYKAVMSCGFTVDGEGRKMSKSLGNGVDPADVIAQSGADVLRLWVGSVDYSQDVSISEEILKRTSESYRSLRNTYRYLLSNLYDFEQGDTVSADEMLEVDKWALAKVADLLSTCTKHYDEYHFHNVYRAVLEYTSELSSVYMDMLKDRLYSAAPKSIERRSAQTALSNILEVLVRVMSPILTFTCDEVWENYPEGMKAAYGDAFPECIQLAGWPEASYFTPQLDEATCAQLLSKYETVFEARDVVTKALEEARGAGTINKSQEAAITLCVPAAMKAVLDTISAPQLADIFIVSTVSVEEGSELSATVSVATGEKCPRCWNYRTLGGDSSHPELCDRCAQVMEELGE